MKPGEMKNLPALLLCVAVCSAYPLDRAAEEDNMDLVQVVKGAALMLIRRARQETTSASLS